MRDSDETGSAPTGPTQPSRGEALRILGRHARRHRGVAAIGMLGTVFVVLTRLALPWPLRGVIEAAFPESGGETFLGGVVPDGRDPLLVLCGAYLFLAIATGLSEFVQRVWTTRFVGKTVHDLRAAALTAVHASPGASNPADLIARVVGDSARLKANLIGILVHLSQNGLLILGVTVVFLVLAPKLGLLFLLSGLLAVFLGYLAVDEVTETSRRQREIESRYAEEVHRAGPTAPRRRGKRLNRKSLRRQVTATRLVGRTTLIIHVAVASTISLALWTGVHDVRTGQMAAGELFLFIAYALTLHRRAVRVGRQVARTGKVVANAQRLGALVQPGRELDPVAAVERPEELRLAGVRLRAALDRRRRSRVGRLDVAFPAGARVAVLGSSGAGKSSLLTLLAGEAEPSGGDVFWQGSALSRPATFLRSAAAFVPHDPEVPALRIRELLGLPEDPVPGSNDARLLEALGVGRLVRTLRAGLDAVPDEARLTVRERRSLALAAVARGQKPLWVLDEPIESGRRGDRRRLEALLGRAGGRTVVAALRGPWCVDAFTQVVVLRKGKVVFDGSPREWHAWNREVRANTRLRA